MPEIIVTKLSFVKGYNFKVEFDLKEIPPLLVDEGKPVGDGLGPNPVRLLSTAVGHCLSSSLLYCLRRSRVDVKNLETLVQASVGRNEEGRLRVKNIEVQLRLDVDEKDKAHLSRCLEIFEDYCTVTQSVMKGIDVKVSTADMTRG